MTQELRRLAEAATQGEWKWDGNVCDYDPYHESPWLVDEKDSYPPILGGQIKCANPANASYIAAANPAAILELLDRLEKAEKDAERCKRFIDAMCEETFDTWTNGYRMQQVAMNIQHSMNITAAMEASK